MTIAYSYIRFSTPLQSKGTSYKRQLEMSKQWAKEMGWDLKDVISDKGVSAFKGKNRDFGELSKFIDLVKKGKIQKDSVLIVENLDRLSRQNYRQAINLFQEIIDADIQIAVLPERKVYNKQLIDDNMFELFMAATIFLRANDESKTKSERHLKNWEYKRKSAIEKKKPMTKMCPAWLKIQNQQFIPIKEKIELINRIFAMSKGGYGKAKILNTLNSEGVKTLDDNDLWQMSSMVKLLRNKSLIGEYQPHQILYDKTTGKRKRIPLGDPIIDYFPKVIDENLFYEVQAIIDSRKQIIRGGHTKSLNNLFVGLVYCSNCGSTYNYIAKNRKENNVYLVCSKALRHGGCRYDSVIYSDFEYKILKHLLELDLQSIIDPDQKIDLKKIQSSIVAESSKLSEKAKQIKRLIDNFAEETDKDLQKMIRSKIDGLKEESNILRNTIKTLETELNHKQSFTSSLNANMLTIEELYNKMDTFNDTEKYEKRLLLQRSIQSIVEKIVVGCYRDNMGKKTFSYTITLKNGIERSISESMVIDIDKNNGDVDLLYSDNPLHQLFVSNRL